MELITNRQLFHGEQLLAEGQSFEESDPRIAAELLNRGLVRKAEPPTVIYEKEALRNQDHSPEEIASAVSARPPFRDMPVCDAEPQAVATESHPVLPAPDLSKPRVADRGGRRGRSGSRSR